jgi:ABC-type nitrate/sulfonate/bicarbonate transport system substrate-binding protein
MNDEHVLDQFLTEEETSRPEFFRRVGSAAALLTVGKLASNVSWASAASALDPGIPKVDVRFGMSPYGDHTFYVIGMRKGWYRDVGITVKPEPLGLKMGLDQVTPFLINGQLDITTDYTPIEMAAIAKNTGVEVFAFADFVAGLSILARPKSGAKTLSQNLKKQKFAAAMKSTMGQLRGKRFVTAPEQGIRPFVDLCFRLGGLTTSATKYTVIADPQLVQLANSGQADFAAPAGLPQLQALKSAGWYPIVDAAGLLKYGPKTNEITPAVGHSGLATTKTYYAQNFNTILRFTSVMFRVIDAIFKDYKAVLPLQIPYLASVSGQQSSPKDLFTVLTKLGTITDFEHQGEWFTKPSSGLYYKRIYNGQLQELQKTGVLPKDQKFDCDHSIVARNVYTALAKYKREYQKLKPRATQAKGRNAVLARAAARQYKNRNYFDAARLAREAVK